MDTKSCEKKSKKRGTRLDGDTVITAELKPEKKTKTKHKGSDEVKTELDTKSGKPTRIYNKKVKKTEDETIQVIRGPLYVYF